MADPNVFLNFLWAIFKYGGIIIAGYGAYRWIKAGKDKDPDARDEAMWSVLGGVAAYAIGAYLSGTVFPTI